MFSVHTTPEKFENSTINGQFGFVFEENSAGKSHNYCKVIVFEKLRFKVFSVHTRTKTRRFQITQVLKGVFEKLLFPDGLVWTVGLTVEIKLRFQIPPA